MSASASASPRLRAICVMGPTCSGKTELVMQLADTYPVELISVDSVQVYRGMNIGTAKPDADTLAAYPHHHQGLVQLTYLWCK